MARNQKKTNVRNREFHPGDDVWEWMAENTKDWDIAGMKEKYRKML